MTDDRTERRILENNRDEREISDDKYAAKIVERIVFALIGLICLAVVAKFTGKI